jgi:hypothetical protein
MDLKEQNDNLLESISYDFDYISMVNGSCDPKSVCIFGTFNKMMTGVLGDQTGNAVFLENGTNTSADWTLVPYYKFIGHLRDIFILGYLGARHHSGECERIKHQLLSNQKVPQFIL